jgi:hypothetical protein
MDERILASSLHNELTSRFPEIATDIEDNRELPYLQMHALVDWLASVSRDRLATEVVERIKSFADWCDAQPKGDDAGSDMRTIFVVEFLEKLFRTESSRPFLPHLISKKQLIVSADYLRRWVDERDYNAALALYVHD